MMFDVNDTNKCGECLCHSCKNAEIKKIKSKKVEEFILCRKWLNAVQNVGVCKYYEDINK